MSVELLVQLFFKTKKKNGKFFSYQFVDNFSTLLLCEIYIFLHWFGRLNLFELLAENFAESSAKSVCLNQESLFFTS